MTAKNLMPDGSAKLKTPAAQRLESVTAGGIEERIRELKRQHDRLLKQHNECGGTNPTVAAEMQIVWDRLCNLITAQNILRDAAI
jgi:hypothetical protein